MKNRIRKKVVMVMLLMLLTTASFGEIVNTTEGRYIVNISYVEQFNGQTSYETFINKHNNYGIKYRTITKLSNGQWECVNKALSRYKCIKGDTFYIIITPEPEQYHGFLFICEFTSNTQYKYWILYCYE